MAVQQDQESLSMIERVARAIVENPPEERQESTPDGWRIIRNFERTARAAIEAMREPTDEMVRAMIWQVNAWQDEKGTDQDVWYAPIDAALKEQP